jgi:hypothetical protein
MACSCEYIVLRCYDGIRADMMSHMRLAGSMGFLFRLDVLAACKGYGVYHGFH